MPRDTCDRMCACPHTCKIPRISEKSPVRTLLLTVQLHMPNRNYVVATATLVNEKGMVPQNFPQTMPFWMFFCSLAIVRFISGSSPICDSHRKGALLRKVFMTILICIRKRKLHSLICYAEGNRVVLIVKLLWILIVRCCLYNLCKR